jgi:hypothetical protein
VEAAQEEGAADLLQKSPPFFFLTRRLGDEGGEGTSRSPKKGDTEEEAGEREKEKRKRRAFIQVTFGNYMAFRCSIQFLFYLRAKSIIRSSVYM